MAAIDAIPIPLPHVGSVNAWLLRGDPVTLIDTGPRSDEALDALERGLRLRGMQVEDIELVIATHHHHDHVGPRCDDQAAGRCADRGARCDGCVRSALRRERRRRSAILVRAHACSRRP